MQKLSDDDDFSLGMNSSKIRFNQYTTSNDLSIRFSSRPHSISSQETSDNSIYSDASSAFHLNDKHDSEESDDSENESSNQILYIQME